jgi:hypothetical protein
MTDRAQDDMSLVFDKRYISELSERITTLRERIIIMVEEGQETRSQSELLFEMIRVLKATKALRPNNH